MFNLIRSKTLNHFRLFSCQISSKNELFFLQNHPFSSSTSGQKTSKSVSKSRNNRSFAVSYLTQSCGLSQERALLASKKVSFETPEKPDSVLTFLKNHGFSTSQVSVVIRKYPRILVGNPENVFTPKFEFLQSLGFSRSEITTLLTKSQNLVVANITQVIPNFSKLNSIFSSQNDTVFCIKRYPDILARNFQTRVAENFEIFRAAGVADANILMLLKRQPRAFLTCPDRVKDSVEELKKMDFNPQLANFVSGAYVMIAINRSIWKDKIELFNEKWGISEEEVKAAFRLNPWCMAASKEQIQKVMDFFVHEMGFNPLDVIKKPIMFSLSLKRTIIPRYSVYQVLLSKGLVKRQLSISVFKYDKQYFIEKFVNCHSKKAPELLKLIQQTS